MTCIKEIAFAVACSLPRPDAAEPVAFGYGPATNRAVFGNTFVPPTPVIGPVVAWRPKASPARRSKTRSEGLAVLTAYAAGKPDKRSPASFKGKLFVLSDGNEKTGCLHKDKRLYTAMKKISRHFGKPLVIESAYRSRAYNDALRRRGKGAAKNSLHIQCRAIDFRVRGVPIRKIAKYAATLKEVGGIGTYRTWVHIDTGRRRYW